MSDLIKTLVGSDVRPKTLGLGGTDLGIWWDMGNGEFGALFGDSFEDNVGRPGWWRSPVGLVSTATDLDSGITFDRALAGGRELLPNAHQKWYEGEVTKIPTDVFVVDGIFCMSYMSVNNWDHGTWETNYAGLAFSADRGETWDDHKLWNNNLVHSDIFQMQSWIVDGNYAYCLSTSNGRHLADGLFIQRAPVGSLSDLSTYEGWGYDKDSRDWKWGRPPSPIITGIFGEPHWRKIEGNWVISVFEPTRYAVTGRVLDGPTGNAYTAPRHDLATGVQFPRLYGGFFHPLSTMDNLHYSISQWGDNADPYHVMQVRGSLPRVVAPPAQNATPSKGITTMTAEESLQNIASELSASAGLPLQENEQGDKLSLRGAFAKVLWKTTKRLRVWGEGTIKRPVTPAQDDDAFGHILSARGELNIVLALLRKAAEKGSPLTVAEHDAVVKEMTK